MNALKVNTGSVRGSSATKTMRILIDSGDYRCSNMGDLAMLQVAVARLNRLFPAAVIQVVTSNPQVVENEVAPARALPFEGLQQWFAERYLLGVVHQALPPSASRAIGMVKGGFRRRWPVIVEAMVRAKLRLSRVTDASILEFLRSMHEADFVVVCGQGGINDQFPKHALAVINFVDMAIRNGKPTVLFSQGIGPIRDPDLLKKAALVLSRADLIALREGKSGPALLQRMNIAASGIVTTGDDAIELAYDVRPEALGEAIGINIRFADHTAIESELVSRLRPLCERLARAYRTKLLPIPISRYPDCKDARDIQQLLSGIEDFEDNGRDLDTPLKVIRQVGRCRVVVTAAYHAAVFALSQGIPVVGLARSQYCLDKFLGLVHQFGRGVEIVRLDSPTFEAELIGAFERVWTSAETLRASLLEASRQQIETGRAAYTRAAEVLTYKQAAA